MKDFNARTDGINVVLADDLFEVVDGSAAKDSLKPGILLVMGTDATYGLLGDVTVAMTNKHTVYYCNSWADSVSMYGNKMVSAIPVTKQFEYEITFDAADSAVESRADFAPGDLVCITNGVYAEANTTGDYVIGFVKSGTATYAAGGTLTIATWGGDYEVAGN